MMTRTFGLAAASALACAAAMPAFAADETVAIGPPPAWAAPSPPLPAPSNAGGLLFVERQDMQFHLDAGGQSQFQSYRFKLLHPQALQLGNVMLSWKPSSGSATVHAVTIHRDGQAINVLDKAKFEVLRREDQLEQATLSGLATGTLQVPDLRVGDVLEVSYTLRDADPTLGGAAAGFWTVAETPLPGQYRMALSWDAGQEPRTRISPDLQDAVKTAPAGLAIALTNPPPLPAPKDAPLRYGWRRVAEYSDFPEWSAVAAKFAPLYAEASRLKPGSPLKEEAARIKAAHPDEAARAGAALKLVQQQVRYVYVGLGAGNLAPASADVSWERRFADCKGKTALLLALLAELGIRGEAMLVNNAGTDDGMNERLPSPGYFDHVLVRAILDGKPHWLDATLPPVAAPQLRPVIDYRWVLPVRPGAALEAVAWQPYAQPTELVLFDIDASKGFDTPATTTTTRVLRGVQGLAQYAQLSALTDDQIEAALKQELTGSTEWNEIEDVAYRYDEKTAASILTIKGTSAVDWQRDDDGERSLSLPGGGFSPPGRRAREAAQDAKAPFANDPDYDCRVTTVRLPADTAAANWRVNTSYVTMMYGETYHRAMERRGHSIRMVRGFRTEDREISAETAARDNARLARFDNSMAWITYTPETSPGGALQVVVSPPPGRVPSVPAADERDWTAADAPCLAPDLRKESLQ